MSDLQPCTHEEAGTHILLHVKHVHCWHNKMVIWSVDTDIVVLAVCKLHELHAEKLWIAFGVGNYFRYIAVHNIACKLEIDKSIALPLFHRLPGCDTSSFVTGKGKSMWDT